jgi:hypothetical protein
LCLIFRKRKSIPHLGIQIIWLKGFGNFPGKILFCTWLYVFVE